MLLLPLSLLFPSRCDMHMRHYFLLLLFCFRLLLKRFDRSTEPSEYFDMRIPHIILSKTSLGTLYSVFYWHAQLNDIFLLFEVFVSKYFNVRWILFMIFNLQTFWFVSLFLVDANANSSVNFSLSILRHILSIKISFNEINNKCR